jgi:hypothetical protein
MAKVDRRERCRCGSGKRAKRCCGVSVRAEVEDRARAELSELVHAVCGPLLRHSGAELHALLAQVTELPRLEASLAWPLPRIHPPEVEAVRAAVDAEDLEGVKAALPAAVAAVDSQMGRAHLARTLLGMRDAGRLHPDLAAAAVVDLASGSPQLLTASLVQALVRDARVARSPDGLILARS